MPAGPVLVAVEFASHGCLKDFLRRNRPRDVTEFVSSGYADFEPEILAAHVANDNERELLLQQTGQAELTSQSLVLFAFQVARGMEYLASKQVRRLHVFSV